MSTAKKDKADAKKAVIDKTSDKYKILLKYVNKLLENVEGVDPVKELLEFQGVNRLDIIKEEGQQVYKDMMGELYEIFDKKKCKYYERAAANAPLNSLRAMCKDIGLKLQVKKKEIYCKGGYHRTSYCYDIINI